MTLSPTVFFVRPIRLYARDRRTNNRQRGTFMWSTWLSDIAFRAKISYLGRKLRWSRKPSADGGICEIPIREHQMNVIWKYELILKKCCDFRAPDVSDWPLDCTADTSRIREVSATRAESVSLTFGALKSRHFFRICSYFEDVFIWCLSSWIWYLPPSAEGFHHHRSFRSR